MKTSVAILILLVCLSGMTINQADGLFLRCYWGGCPSARACNFCCRRLRRGCIGGTCVRRRRLWSWTSHNCQCNCPFAG